MTKPGVGLMSVLLVMVAIAFGATLFWGGFKSSVFVDAIGRPMWGVRECANCGKKTDLSRQADGSRLCYECEFGDKVREMRAAQDEQPVMP